MKRSFMNINQFNVSKILVLEPNLKKTLFEYIYVLHFLILIYIFFFFFLKKRQSKTIPRKENINPFFKETYMILTL